MYTWERRGGVGILMKLFFANWFQSMNVQFYFVLTRLFFIRMEIHPSHSKQASKKMFQLCVLLKIAWHVKRGSASQNNPLELIYDNCRFSCIKRRNVVRSRYKINIVRWENTTVQLAEARRYTACISRMGTRFEKTTSSGTEKRSANENVFSWWDYYMVFEVLAIRWIMIIIDDEWDMIIILLFVYR